MLWKAEVCEHFEEIPAQLPGFVLLHRYKPQPRCHTGGTKVTVSPQMSCWEEFQNSLNLYCMCIQYKYIYIYVVYIYIYIFSFYPHLGVVYMKSKKTLGFTLYSQLLLSLLLLLLHLFMEKIDSHSQLLFPQIGQDPTHNPTTWTSSVCVKLSSLSQRRNSFLIRKELKGISSMPTCHSYCQHQQQRRPYYINDSNMWPRSLSLNS